MVEEKKAHEITEAFIEDRPLSYSSLKQFRRSPKHYVQYLTKPFKPSPQMVLGSLVDVMVLTPDKFDETYTIVKLSMKATASSTDKSKERWKGIKAEAKENKKVIIFSDMYETAKNCVAALNAHPQAKEMLDNMKRSQVRLKWKDSDTKLPLIGYADFETVFRGNDTVVDLKTTANADPIDFAKSVINFGYDFQGALYLDAYHKSKFRFPEYYWLCVETSAPFGVSVNRFQPNDIDIAKEEMFNTLKAFKYCLENERFDMGYEFRLFDALPYHQMQLPKWRKSIFG